jgi:flagellar basal body rod protein FlgG
LNQCSAGIRNGTKPQQLSGQLCNLITTGLKTSENQFTVLIYNHHSPAGKKKEKKVMKESTRKLQFFHQNQDS